MKASPGSSDRGNSQKLATWKRYLKVILIIIQLSIKLSNYLVITKKATNPSENHKFSSTIRAQIFLSKDQLATSKPLLLLHFLHMNIRDQMTQLKIHKLLKSWRNTHLKLLKTNSKKHHLKHSAIPKVVSSMMFLLTIEKTLDGKDKIITNLITVVEQAARLGTAIKKMSWKEQNKRPQRKLNRLSERPEWKFSKRKAEERIWSGLV